MPKDYFHSFEEFKNHYFPKSREQLLLEMTPEELGEHIAKEALQEIRSVLEEAIYEINSIPR